MKKIFLAALAGAMFFACQKNETSQTFDGDTKTVAVNIETLASATRADLGYNIKDGADYTALEKGTLYFFNGIGEVVTTWVLTDAQIAAKEAIVEKVDKRAETVALIANQPNDLTSTAPTTFVEFKALSLGIADQVAMSDATGGSTAAPNAVKGIVLLDECGTKASANKLSVSSTYDPEYNESVPGYDENDPRTISHTASITAVPGVSRIEIGTAGTDTTDPIGAISVKGTVFARVGEPDNLTGLESFDLNGVYVNNYSPTFTAGFAQAAALFGAGIQTGVSPDWTAAYKALTPEQKLYDEFSTPVPVDRLDLVETFAYHVFPGTVPHIIIKGSNFVYEDDPMEEPEPERYWMIDEYYDNGTKIEKFLPGYVYKISEILLGDTVPVPDDPYLIEKKVKVNVTVSPWMVKNTTVTPK